MKAAVALLAALFLSFKALAEPCTMLCPLAIGAGLGLAKKYGMDTCVLGVFSGALFITVGYIFIRVFEKRGWRFRGRNPLLLLVGFSLVGTVYLQSLTYAPTIIGFLYIDSFLLANLLGAAAFIIGAHLYQWMKAKNGGRAHFPFEKTVVPLVLVGLTALMVNYTTFCTCHEEPLNLFEETK